MNIRRHTVKVLLLALAGAGLAAARSRPEKADPPRDEGSEPAPVAASKGEPAAITSAAHAAPAPAPRDLSGSCERICAASSKLNCPQAKTCQPTCAAMGSTGLCGAELGAFFACLEGQPSEHWECLEDGSAAIREGYCESEQATFAQCLQEK